MRLSKLALFAALLAVGGQAAAATDTTTFNVTIDILKSCTISATAATNVDFADTASTSTTDVDAQGSVTALCTPLTPYTIALNAGANAGTANDVNTRRMKNTDGAVITNNYVAYQLYRDFGRTLVWGTAVGTTLAGTGLGLNQVYPVYGRVANPSLNNAAAGAYLDTVTATITY